MLPLFWKPCFTSFSSPQGKIAMSSAVCYEDDFIVPYLFLSDTVARKDYLTVTLLFTFTSKVMLITSLTSLLGIEKMDLLLQCASVVASYL